MQLEHMFGCTCACRHDGHGFNHSEEAEGRGGEQGGRENKGDVFLSAGSFCSGSLRMAKVNNHRHNWEFKKKTHGDSTLERRG